MRELGVEAVHAHSPHTKGRVDRLFGTLQDRLVKEMRAVRHPGPGGVESGAPEAWA